MFLNTYSSRRNKAKDFFFYNISPSSFSLRLGSNLSKDFLIDGEGEVQHVFYVVVLHPLEGLVKLLVQILQVAQVTGTTWWEMSVSVSLCGICSILGHIRHTLAKTYCTYMRSRPL